MHKIITVDHIMSREPCVEYPKSRVQELIGDGKTPVEILKLPISTEDKLKFVLHNDILSQRILRLFACMCAERALERERNLGREPHPDSWRAIEIARKYANGNATDLDLNTARFAVDVDAYVVDTAAYDAVCSAADTVRIDARVAAYNAARVAAYNAARTAECVADYNAEREQQVRDLTNLIQERENVV
jgi:hypothetical protein